MANTGLIKRRSSLQLIRRRGVQNESFEGELPGCPANPRGEDRAVNPERKMAPPGLFFRSNPGQPWKADRHPEEDDHPNHDQDGDRAENSRGQPDDPIESSRFISLDRMRPNTGLGVVAAIQADDVPLL